MAAWFKEFRSEHGFTSYSDNETPVTVDIALLAVTYFCVLLSVATLIATLGIRGREKWSAALRAGYAVAVGSIILVCLVSHGWQQGDVHITSPYVYRSNLPFKGSVGLRVGLHGTNVTLEGYYKGASGKGYVYYAEEMPWADFGHETERYAHFLHRGLPEPVLKVLEFISIDDGGLRWGRSFHTAGHYANVLLWTAFAFWLVTNLLLFSVVVYGAYMFFFTGLTMVLACVSYHACQLEQPLVISFGDVDLRVSYGWAYWLALATGCITLVLGLTLIIFDHFAHDEVAVFFQLERLDDEETFDPCDDRKFAANPSSSLSSYILDRRGSVVPPPQRGENRRNSIFLEPGRRPTGYNEILLKSLGLTPNHSQLFSSAAGSRPGLSRSTCSLNKMAEADVTQTAKTNPIFGMEMEKKFSAAEYIVASDEEETGSDMECVCKDNKVCASTKKPSLATLREHRDNHANEKIYASASGSSRVLGGRGGSSSSLALASKFEGESHQRRASAETSRHHQSTTAQFSSLQPLNRETRSASGSQASSPGGIVLSPDAFPFPPPPSVPDTPDVSASRRSSCPATATAHVHGHSHGALPEVVMETYSRQNSAASSASFEQTSAASSEDSGRGVSDGKTSGADSCSNGDSGSLPSEEDGSQYNSTIIGCGLVRRNEVVVNIESSSL